MDSRYILLVEDNADEETLALRALSRSGARIQVVVARDGAEALDIALARGAYVGADLPEFVLLDLKLPKVSGIEVLRRLRAEARTAVLPIVVLTSSSEERDVSDSYRAGANSYVRKPVDFDLYTRTLAEVGHFWTEINQSPTRQLRQGG